MIMDFFKVEVEGNRNRNRPEFHHYKFLSKKLISNVKLMHLTFLIEY